MPGQVDYTGCRFGKLTVTKQVESRLEGGRMRFVWLCRCDCGNMSKVVSTNLNINGTKSCGCGKVAACKARTVHGMSGTRIHKTWKKMRERCLNPNCKEHKDYGGRGIKICRRWESFKNFAADMGEHPGPGYSIERKNVNGNYCPSNCVWLHRTLQNRNRRDTIRFTFRGVTKTIFEWSDKTGISVQNLKARVYRGWSIRKTLTTPKLKTWSRQPKN